MTTQERPLITFALFAYNQERFIREAMEGAFSQTYSPLEIILPDDCSTDRTFAIMEQMAAAYRGAHKIILNRNEKKLGIVPHCNRVWEIAQGRLIVAAAGDDISMPERTEVLYQTWKHYSGKVVLLMSEYTEIDSQGRIIRANARRFRCDGIELRKVANCIENGDSHGATMMYSREVIHLLGPIHALVEDVTLFRRALLLGKIYYHESVLLKCRVHQSTSKQPNAAVFAKTLKQWHESISRQLRYDIKKIQSIDKKLISQQQIEEILAADARYLNYTNLLCNLHHSHFFGRLASWMQTLKKPSLKHSLILLQFVLPPPIRHIYRAVKNAFK
jgi:glycosyltransferase involved in cell wall biosynthesis